MTRDSSLDDFLGGEETDAPADASEPETPADAVEPEPEFDEDAVEPAQATYAFSPDGAECAACGAVVEKRWRDEAGLVCSECKVW